MKILNAVTCFVFICFSTSITKAEDKELNANQRFFYIGGEIGLVEPVKNKFIHKHSKTEITLKKSSMYSFNAGYSFYPQMSIELSTTYQPKYRLSYIIPEKTLANGLVIPKTPGKTRVFSNIYMANIIYDLQNYNGFVPYVIMGVGIAKVKVKPVTSKLDTLGNIDFFRVKTTHTNCLAWQLGIGMSKEITDNLSVNLSAKLQIANNVKIDYETLNMATQQFESASPIKKTIGVGEFGMGFTYKLPI